MFNETLGGVFFHLGTLMQSPDGSICTSYCFGRCTDSGIMKFNSQLELDSNFHFEHSPKFHQVKYGARFITDSESRLYGVGRTTGSDGQEEGALVRFLSDG